MMLRRFIALLVVLTILPIIYWALGELLIENLLSMKKAQRAGKSIMSE